MIRSFAFTTHGKLHTNAWSPDDGPILRASRTDVRNADGVVRFSSLLIDARKPLLSLNPT